ncbi:MAG: hypothetical protein H6581_23510 [Bacteroidia bacterium]|nr:hypothetical protein [Bacteroidia bacterium]
MKLSIQLTILAGIFFLLSGLSVQVMAQAPNPSGEKAPEKNFMGIDENSVSPDEYARLKSEWIKNNPEKYQAMNPGTPRPKEEGPTELVLTDKKEYKAEEGTNPLANYVLKDIPQEARGTWVLSDLQGVILRDDITRAQADQLALEATHDLPLKTTILKLQASTFDSQWGEGKYLKGECGFETTENQIMLTRSRLCQTCNPILQFRVLEMSKGKMQLRLEDEDGSRIYYQLTFTKTN